MKRSILVGFIALLCWSCSKDEFTKPVAVNLEMEIENQEVGVNERVELNTIHIERGRYLISEVEFKAYRESGEDYFFEKEYEGGLEAFMAAGIPATAFQFDMPQGLYERISISLKVNKSSGDDQDDDDDSDDGRKEADDRPFDESASLILYGTYTSAQEKQIPLIFVYNYDDTFEFTAKATNAEEVIMVGDGQQVEARLKFKPAYWLQLINSRMLQSAQLTLVNGVETIILSEKQNNHIFDLLTSRIKGASDLSID
jgi:hypothetical protein